MKKSNNPSLDIDLLTPKSSLINHGYDRLEPYNLVGAEDLLVGRSEQLGYERGKVNEILGLIDAHEISDVSHKVAYAAFEPKIERLQDHHVAVVEAPCLTADHVFSGSSHIPVSGLFMHNDNYLRCDAALVETSRITTRDVVFGSDHTAAYAAFTPKIERLEDQHAAVVEAPCLTADHVFSGSSHIPVSRLFTHTNEYLRYDGAALVEASYITTDDLVTGSNNSAARAQFAGTNKYNENNFWASAKPECSTDINIGLSSISSQNSRSFLSHNVQSAHRESSFVQKIRSTKLSIVDYIDNGLLTAAQPYRISHELGEDTLNALQSNVESALSNFKGYSPIQRYSLGFENGDNKAIINIFIIQGDVNGDNLQFGDNYYSLKNE